MIIVIRAVAEVVGVAELALLDADALGMDGGENFFDKVGIETEALSRGDTLAEERLPAFGLVDGEVLACLDAGNLL